ncbi:MAG: flagellar hook-basal body complex protein FliE [Campylobacterota bacterium]|nr:flagellar hook-basal body complex protein FliE [Campylobacterota bacterium]
MKIGEITNSVSGLNKSSLLDVVGINNTKDGQTNQESFASVLKQSLEDVNTNQVKAYDAMHDIATGKVENLQEAVQKIEEAELSLKLGLEVKNKALGAYKQVMSMQI